MLKQMNFCQTKEKSTQHCVSSDNVSGLLSQIICVNIPSFLLLLLQLSFQLHLLLLAFLLPPHPFLQQCSPLLSHVLLGLSILLSQEESKVSHLTLLYKGDLVHG